jgi:hypothetical protein
MDHDGLQPMDTAEDLDAERRETLFHSSQEAGGAHALAQLALGVLPELKTPPTKPFSPRSVGAGLQEGREQMADVVRGAKRDVGPGPRTQLQRALDTAAGAPAAKFGSSRYRAAVFAGAGVSKSTVLRWDGAGSKDSARPDLRGGHNRRVSPFTEALLGCYVDFAAERDLHVDSADIQRMYCLFESMAPLLHKLQPYGSDSDSEEPTTDEEDGSDSDRAARWAAAPPKSDPPEQCEPAAAPSSASAAPPAAAASVPRAQPSASTPQAASETTSLPDSFVPRHVEPLSQPTLSRLCDRLGISLQKAQPRKAGKMRESRPAEIGHFRLVANLWPAVLLFVYDETQVTHQRPPRRTYRRRNAGGAHTRGQARGESSTLVFAVSWCARDAFVCRKHCMRVHPCCCLRGFAFAGCVLTLDLVRVPLACLCSDADNPRLFEVFLIPGHKKLPESGGRECPLKGSMPCPCDRVDVAGVHQEHMEYIIGRWAAELAATPGAALIHDQLRAHLTRQAAEFLFKARCTPLAMYPGESPVRCS